MVITPFGLNGFNDDTRNWAAFLLLGIKNLLNLSQTPLVLGGIFAHKF
jgi:hypothetical protein